MREICSHSIIANRINFYKPHALELNNIPQFFFHQRFAGTSDLPLLREKGAGYQILCRQPLDDMSFG
jgi:hypothetical protein